MDDTPLWKTPSPIIQTLRKSQIHLWPTTSCLLIKPGQEESGESRCHRSSRRNVKRIVALLIVAGMIGHITAYAAFPPISTASWQSEFRKIEIVEEEAAPDEPVLVTDSLATPSDLGMADSSDEVVDDALVPSDEVVDDAMVPSDEVVDFTGDVVLYDQNSVVPDTTAYDGEQNDVGGVFVIVAVEDQDEIDGSDEPEEPIEEQQEPITTPDEAAEDK